MNPSRRLQLEQRAEFHHMGTLGLYGRWGLSCWGLIIENEPIPHPIPLLRIMHHPTDRTCSVVAEENFSVRIKKGFMVQSNTVAESHWASVPHFPQALVTAGWRCVGMGDSSKQTLLISNETLRKGSQTGMRSLTSAAVYAMRHVCLVTSVMSDSVLPMDCSLPGSSVHEILQARILESAANSFSRESYWPRDWTYAL